MPATLAARRARASTTTPSSQGSIRARTSRLRPSVPTVTSRAGGQVPAGPRRGSEHEQPQVREQARGHRHRLRRPHRRGQVRWQPEDAVRHRHGLHRRRRGRQARRHRPRRRRRVHHRPGGRLGPQRLRRPRHQPEGRPAQRDLRLLRQPSVRLRPAVHRRRHHGDQVRPVRGRRRRWRRVPLPAALLRALRPLGRPHGPQAVRGWRHRHPDLASRSLPQRHHRRKRGQEVQRLPRGAGRLCRPVPAARLQGHCRGRLQGRDRPRRD